METMKPRIQILKILLKDVLAIPTITFLAKELSISRVGAWKILKKLEEEKLVVLSSIGSGKTSTYIVRLNWDNIILEKTLSLALTQDSIKSRRWLNNFAELENKLDFLIIYGSILQNQKDARDIDILGVTNKTNFLAIEESIKKIQKTQLKKIHSINFTQKELKSELEKSNKAFIDALKKGIILFGQEKFIKFMKSITRR